LDAVNNAEAYEGNKKPQRGPLILTNDDVDFRVEKPEQGAHYELVVNNDIILNILANGTGTV
jgi:hypothetical protein